MPTHVSSFASIEASAVSKPNSVCAKTCFGRQVAQHLPDVANLHLASRRGLRRSAVLQLFALRLGRAHFFAVCGYFVAQSLVQQLLAELRERLRVGLGQLRIPADVVCNLRSMAEGRRHHQLKILLVLGRGAARHLVDPFAMCDP